jgi:hypothetical protein
MAPIHREYRLFVAPSRAIRFTDQSPRDRMSVTDAPYARHILYFVSALEGRPRVDPECAVAFA